MEFTAATYEGESCLQVVLRRRMEFDPELAREVEDLRQRDQVTGLLNRRELDRLLAAERQRAGGGQRGGQAGEWRKRRFPTHPITRHRLPPVPHRLNAAPRQT